jgi:hypothetical protein
VRQGTVQMVVPYGPRRQVAAHRLGVRFASLAFAKILSEARKWHLSIVLAHQFIDQIAE